MDYLIEAKKFIQRARQADVPEVTQTDLEMAEWLLSREIEEREHAPTKRSQVKPRDTPLPEAVAE